MIGRKGPPIVSEVQGPKGFDDFQLRLGDIMRGERATLGKSLLDVQRELKIKANYIAAIENSDLSAFETPGFIAGYVRSYARYLGMDPDAAFDTFCDEAGFTGVHGMQAAANAAPRNARPAQKRNASDASDPLLASRTPFVPERGAALTQVEPGALGAMAVMVALIGALGYGGWTVLQEVQRVTVVPVDETPIVGDLDPVAGAMRAPDADAEVARVQAEALDRLYRPAALDVPVLVARDGPIAALDPDRVGALAPAFDQRPSALPAIDTAGPATALAAADPGATPAPRVVGSDVNEIELVAVRPAWVRVTGADGSVLFEKILDAGERYVLPKTEEPPSLRAGNSGALYFAVNGETYGPAGPGASVAKQVVLAAASLQEVYQPADVEIDPDLIRVLRQPSE